MSHLDSPPHLHPLGLKEVDTCCARSRPFQCLCGGDGRGDLVCGSTPKERKVERRGERGRERESKRERETRREGIKRQSQKEKT